MLLVHLCQAQKMMKLAWKNDSQTVVALLSPSNTQSYSKFMVCALPSRLVHHAPEQPPPPGLLPLSAHPLDLTPVDPLRPSVHPSPPLSAPIHPYPPLSAPIRPLQYLSVKKRMLAAASSSASVANTDTSGWSGCFLGASCPLIAFTSHSHIQFASV